MIKHTKSKEPEEIHQPVITQITTRKNGTRRVAQSFKGIESETEQSDMPMTSIRNLLNRGLDVQQGAEEAQYGDFSDIGDYQTQMERIAQAHDSFETLPAKIRAKFQNNPANLIDFTTNPDNKDDAIRMGLIPDPNAAPSSNNNNPEASDDASNAATNDHPSGDPKKKTPPSKKPKTTPEES